MKNVIYGKRFCTYCGGWVYYGLFDGELLGICQDCDNIDYCDGETIEDVKRRFGKEFIEIK